MLSLSSERIWTIMFTIPLPLMLSSGAMAHEPAGETKPIVTTQMAVEQIKLEWSQRHALPDIAFDYPRGACSDKESMPDAGPALCDHIAAEEAVALGCNRGDSLSRDFVTVEETSPTRLFCASAPVTSRRCDDFVSFQAQAPPRFQVATKVSPARFAVLPLQRKVKPHIHPFSAGPSTLARPTPLNFAAVVILDSLPVLESWHGLLAVTIRVPEKNSGQRKGVRSRSDSSQLVRT